MRRPFYHSMVLRGATHQIGSTARRVPRTTRRMALAVRSLVPTALTGATTTVIVLNLLADLLYGVLNPKVKYE